MYDSQCALEVKELQFLAKEIGESLLLPQATREEFLNMIHMHTVWELLSVSPWTL